MKNDRRQTEMIVMGILAGLILLVGGAAVIASTLKLLERLA